MFRSAIRPDQVFNPTPDSTRRRLTDTDFDSFESAIRKPPKEMAAFMVFLQKRSPLRLRRIRSDLAWIEKMAKKQGLHDVYIPDWLKK
jgi:hypothetical protein